MRCSLYSKMNETGRRKEKDKRELEKGEEDFFFYKLLHVIKQAGCNYLLR